MIHCAASGPYLKSASSSPSGVLYRILPSMNQGLSEYTAGWSKGSHDPGVPGWRGGQRRIQACELQNCAGACADSLFVAIPAVFCNFLKYAEPCALSSVFLTAR